VFDPQLTGLALCQTEPALRPAKLAAGSFSRHVATLVLRIKKTTTNLKKYSSHFGASSSSTSNARSSGFA